MRPGEARSRYTAPQYDRSWATEEKVRRAAQSVVERFPGRADVRLAWMPALPSYVNPLPVDVVLQDTLIVHVPGSDFAAQLVVEQQIREQIA